MPDPAGNPQGKRHVLSDWLTLHGLDQRSCQRMLDAIAWQADDAAAARERPTAAYEAPDLDAAWAAIVQSMRTLLPGRESVIDDTFAGTARIVVDRRGKARKALTLDNGPTAYPTILFGYRDGPADPVIMAHEFGHALQIRASGSRFIPPILREVCAFLGEAALLSHARQGDGTQREWLAHIWRRDDARYFGAFKDRLEAALLQPATPYSYAWNYPIARSLAIRLFERRSQEQLWRVFGGEVSVLALHEDSTLI